MSWGSAFEELGRKVLTSESSSRLSRTTAPHSPKGQLARLGRARRQPIHVLTVGEQNMRDGIVTLVVGPSLHQKPEQRLAL